MNPQQQAWVFNLAYIQFCQNKGLNPNDQNSYNIFNQCLNNNNNIWNNPQPQNIINNNNFNNNNNLNFNNNFNNNFNGNNAFNNNNNINLNFNKNINNNPSSFNNNFNPNNFNNFNNNFNNFNNNLNNINNNHNNFSNNHNNMINMNLANNSLININQNLNNKKLEEEIFNNNGTIYMSQTVEEVMPRKEETLYVNKEMQNQPDTINVTFYSSTGFNIMITVSKFISFEELFKIYMKRLNLPDTHIGNDILFSFNGKIVDHKSKVPIWNFLIMNNSRIEVLDIGNVLGA